MNGKNKKDVKEGSYDPIECAIIEYEEQQLRNYMRCRDWLEDDY